MEFTTTLSCPEKAKQKIIEKIEGIQRHQAQRNFMTFTSVLLFALVALASSVVSAVYSFSHSGFYQYWSLLFSDGKYVMNSFGEFIISLTETIPFANLTLVFLSVFVVLFAARKIGISIRKYSVSTLVHF